MSNFYLKKLKKIINLDFLLLSDVMFNVNFKKL